MDITLTMLLDLALPKHGAPDDDAPSLPVRGIRIFGDREEAGEIDPACLYVRKRKRGVTLLCGGEKYAHDDDGDFASVFNNLQDAFISLRDWDMRLHEGIIEKKGLQYMIDVSEHLFARPMTINDPGYKLIAHTKVMQDGDSIFKEAAVKGYVSESALRTLDDAGYVFAHDSIYYRAAIPGLSYPMLNGSFGIQPDGHSRYMLTLVFPKDDFNAGTEELFAVFLAQLELYVERNDDTRQIKKLARDSLLSDLLEAKCDAVSLAERNRYSHIPEQGPFALFYIQRQRDYFTHEHLHEKISALFPQQIAFGYGMDELLLLRMAADNDEASSADRLRPLLDGSHLALGISARFDGLLDLARAFEEAQTAIRIGQRISENRTLAALGLGQPAYETSVFRYAQYYAHSAVLANRSPEELLRLLPQNVRDLLIDKSKYGLESLRLLYAYFQNDCNKVHTAEALFMHRNNINYRFSKIEERLGISLSDPEVKAGFRIAFLLLELIPPALLS